MRFIVPRMIAVGLRFRVVGLAVLMGVPGSGAVAAEAAVGLEPISLASEAWQFQIDRDDAGTSQSWWKRELEGTIRLPGSMTEQNRGDEISKDTPWTQEQPRLEELFAAPELQPYLQPGNFKSPFWLTPLKYYRGAAWYQRDFTVPEDWADRGVMLHLERPHWRTDVWVDGEHKGFRDSLSTPHEYRVGMVKPGKHRLTIRVDNRVQAAVGLNAHSISDHTQGNWNGIVGDIELRPYEDDWLTSIKIHPDAESRSVRVDFNRDGSNAGAPVEGDRVEVAISRKDSSEVIGRASVPVSQDLPLEAVVKLDGPVELWDEFTPNLYQAKVRYYGQRDYLDKPKNEGSAATLMDEEIVTFGFRDFETSRTEFVVNGRPTFLRGTLECCIFPLTGYPPTDVEEWRRIMNVLKAHGLNHLRFHSWCPPEAAFDAADEEGIYFSIECASWSKSVGDPDYMEWLYAESRRIVDEFGNHPSFCMFLYGNEPAGETKKIYMDALDEFVGYWDEREDRFLVSGGAGWPWLPNNEFYVTQIPRIQHWGEGLKSRVNSKPPETVTDYHDYVHKFSEPVISHEIGQWCVYPNFDERSKYTGALRALNFDIFEDTLTKHHMRDQARDFLMASGKLQALLYKEDIESALRTQGMGGFQLLDLHDFPGQGTALVGVLDPFWDEKGYISAEEYSRFTGPVVPLALLSKRVFTADENLTATVELANYGAEAIRGAAPEWSLTRADGSAVAQGEFAEADFPVGNGHEVGRIDQPLDMISEAEKLTLNVSLPGTDVRNSWDVWVYPAKVDEAVPADVLLTRALDEAAIDRLSDGGKVLLVPQADAVKNDPDRRIVPGFSSIFWNTAWTGYQAPHTLGVLCDPEHPALAKFPTDFHTNWQWWYLVHDTPVMLLDSFAPGVLPIVQVIDDWTTNRKLGYLFEANYGGGKLMVCSLPIAEADDPVTRQMRRSVLDYMGSDEFAPKETLSREQLGTILELE